MKLNRILFIFLFIFRDLVMRIVKFTVDVRPRPEMSPTRDVQKDVQKSSLRGLIQGPDSEGDRCHIHRCRTLIELKCIKIIFVQFDARVLTQNGMYRRI